jgi:pimeloyl-ACP methyl ester carboxylesterase
MVYVPWVKWAGAMRVIRKIVRENLVKASGDQTWITDDAIDAYTAGASADLDGTLLAYLSMAEAREPKPISQQLAEIRCPVFLVLGGAPHASRPSDEEVERLRQRVPSFAEKTVPGAGHYLQEERPDVVAAAVLRVDRAALAQGGGRAPPAR